MRAAQESAGSSTTKTLLTADKRLEITVPGNWVEDNTLNDEADLGAQHKVKEQYVVLLDEKKADFDGMTLKKHSELTLGSMKQALTGADVSEARNLTINGCPAIQHIVRGTTDNIKIVFIHTTIETKDSFCQMLAWTLNSQWDENKAPLDKVVESFREVGSAKPAASPKP